MRQRLRDWPTSLTFTGILGLALAVVGVWLAIASPVLRGQLPFPDSSRILALESVKKGQRSGLSWMTLEDLRMSSVRSMAAYLPRTWGFQTDPQSHVEVVLSEQVTGEFFEVLGVAPMLGEPLTRRHEQVGNQAFVWLSHLAWKRLMNGDPLAVAKTVWINAVPFRVAGVMSPSFDFPHRGASPDIYIPLDRATYFSQRGIGAIDAIARLNAGVTRGQFAVELEARANALAVEFPQSNREVQFTAVPLGEFLLGDRLELLKWLLGAVAILLLISIANASGVWLAQWLKQQRHAAIKLSLGATMPRLLLEQSGQAVVLGLASAVMGFVGSKALLTLLRVSSITGPELRRYELWHPATIEPTTVMALMGIAIAAAVGAAVLPVILINPVVHRTARNSGRTRFGLAVVQLTLTGTLAYSGILVWRNVYSLLNADRGFRTEQVLISGIGIPEARYDTDEKMIRFHERAIEELSKIPGVTQAAGGSSMPISNARTRFQLDDDHSAREQQQIARIGIASPGLLKLLDIPLAKGRMFGVMDRWETPHVALVNEAFVHKYLAGQKEPIGHRIRFSFYNGFAAKPYTDHIIAGVVGNTRNRDLALESEPQILISSDQIAMEGFMYFIRSSLPAESLKQAVAQAIWNVDPAIQRIGLRPLAGHVEQALLSRRTLSILLGLFAAISLAIVGFGLTSSLTATFLEMTRELGIRSALGATPARLAYEATRWGTYAITASWALTLPLCSAISRSIAFDSKPVTFDAQSWLIAGITLALIGLAAGLVPARRAASIDPAVMLKDH